MQYVLVIPVQEDEVVTTDPFTQCIRSIKCIGYSLRTYRCSKPFSIDLFKIDKINAISSYLKTLNGVQKQGGIY